MQLNVGIGPVLFLIFMTLKLCGVIAWSWWYVTMPLWIAPVILVAMLSGVALHEALKMAFKK